MTDLHRKELEDFRAYGSTFLGNAMGQRVLADLIHAFQYNGIVIPMDNHGALILEGERNVIRYILTKMGFGEQTEAFVKALAISIPRAPAPIDMGEAITDD